MTPADERHEDSDRGSTSRRRFLGSAALGAVGATALSGRASAQVEPTGVSKFAATIGDGTSTEIDVVHDLATTDVVVEVAEVNGGRGVDCEISHDDPLKITLRFTAPPAPLSLRVTIVG